MRFLLISLAFLGIYVAINLLNGQSEPIADPTSLSVAEVKIDTKKKASSAAPKPRKVIQDMVWKPRESFGNQIDTLSEECQSYLKTLLQMDLENIKTQSLPSLNACKKLPPAISDQAKLIEKACPESLETPEQERRCRITVFQTRNQIGRWEAQNTPLSEIEDPKILASVLLASASGNPQNQDMDRTIEAAKRILELNPNLTPVADLGAGASLVKAFNQSEEVKKDPNNTTWNESLEMINHARELNPDKPATDAAFIYVASKGLETNASMVDALDKLRQDGGDAQVIAYYDALREYKFGNPTNSIEMLRQIDPRAAQHVAKTGKFPFRIGINFDTEEITEMAGGMK